ncbi:MAG TPA: hypothetical protein VFX45_11525 [Solirubrobacterales bacterium]|nr:hypothetical protein [Solirubrobacterales bacterium]
MTRTKARFGVLLALALGATALLALSGIAVAKHGNHHRSSGDPVTIASFDAATGRLTLALSGGEEVSGLVTNRTRIKCEDEHSPDVSARHGEDEPGDDHSGPSGHDDNGTGANCTTSDLIAGTLVDEAELEIEHGQATFRKVELDD